MDIGTAYAEAYQATYEQYSYASYSERVEAATALRDLKDTYTVGTANWHAAIGGLTALNVLTGRDL